MKFSVTALLSCAAVASAASGPTLSGTCAGNRYSADDVSAAADASCKLLKAKKTVGNNNYPHEYKNFEKIKFAVDGPWYEFPIVRSGTFDGNRGPGPDRVIINGDCEEAGLLTHTGATGNGFNSCDVSKGNSGSSSSSSSSSPSSSSSETSSTSTRRGGSRTTTTTSDSTATTTAGARSSSSSSSSAKPTSTNAADALRGSVAGVAAAGLAVAALL